MAQSEMIKPEGPWLLHVPFVAAPNLRFTEEQTNTVAGCTIYLKPDSAPYSCVVIESLATVDEARKRFSDVRRAMLATSLMIGCGIRIKDDVKVFEDDAAQLPSEADQPFICRQERSLARLVINVGEREFAPNRVLADIIQGFKIGLTSSFALDALRDDRVALACDLYTDSWFEKSVATRFISLIGVLEVLKDHDPVSPVVIQLVDDWLGQLHHLETAEADSLSGRLRQMKEISIGRGIGRVISRHLGQDRAREVQGLYSIRSKLVHDGKRPADLDDKLQRTQYIVRELLIKILQAGSR